jgi:hypothetical protein
MTEQDTGVAASSGRRATGPSDLSPASGSSQSSVPNAADIRFLGAGPDPRGGFTFSFADGDENGLIHHLAAHLYDMMGVGTPHELNCVQIEVQPRGLAQAYTLTLQRQNGKTPLRLKAEAVELLRKTLEAIETGRSEPLYIMRDVIRNWLEDDITAQAIEAQRAATAKTGAVEDESAVPEGNAPKGGQR